MSTLLLVAALLFPALSYLTFALSMYDHWRHNKYSSPIFVPFIGPVLLTVWIVVTGRSVLWIPLAWVLDAGTLAFLTVVPQLATEWWVTSAWTRVRELHARRGVWSARLTLHSTGRYLAVFERAGQEPGIAGFTRAGSYLDRGDEIELTGSDGHSAKLVRGEDGAYCVAGDGPPAKTEGGHNEVIDLGSGWRFQPV